jgi:hypothetical protein
MKDEFENEKILIFEHGSIDTSRMIGEELEELDTFKPTFINAFTREIKNQCVSLFHGSSKSNLNHSVDLKSEIY